MDLEIRYLQSQSAVKRYARYLNIEKIDYYPAPRLPINYFHRRFATKKNLHLNRLFFD